MTFAGALLTFGTEFLPIPPVNKWARGLVWAIIVIFVATIAINMVVVFFEEGFNWFLPDNPTSYQLIGFTPKSAPMPTR